MGFSYSFLPFLDACHTNKAIAEPFLSLGSQELHGSPAEGEKEFSGFADLLRKRYGVQNYADIDLNGVSKLHGDLGIPLSEHLNGKWQTIYDGGTLEHVFDIAAAFANVHRLCAVNGTIIHVSPVSWLEHGYYNLSPKLFHSVAKANDYSVLAQAWHFPLVQEDGNAANQRSFLSRLFKGEKTQHKGLFQVEGCHAQDSYAWLAEYGLKHLPENTLYCIAYRKEAQKPFVIPTDIYV